MSGIEERRRSGAEHREFSEDTRPGPHVDRRVEQLDDTVDDGRPLTPIEGIAVDIINDAAARLDRASSRAALDMDMKAAEIGAVHGSAWARGVDQDIANLKRAIAKPRRWHVVKLLGKWITGGVLAAAAAMAIRVLVAHGDAAATDRTKTEMLYRLDRTMRRVLNAISRIAGKLDIDVDLDDTPREP